MKQMFRLLDLHAQDWAKDIGGNCVAVSLMLEINDCWSGFFQRASIVGRRWDKVVID